MRVRFLSGNIHKIDEAIAIMAPIGITVVPIDTKLEELQSSDPQVIVKDKVVKAFHQVGHPITSACRLPPVRQLTLLAKNPAKP